MSDGTDDKVEQGAPLPKWCDGCSPDNCTGCVQYAQLPFAWWRVSNGQAISYVGENPPKGDIWSPLYQVPMPQRDWEYAELLKGLIQEVGDTPTGTAPTCGWDDWMDRAAWALKGWSKKSVSVPSATTPSSLHSLAMRCRPSVAHYMRTQERAAMSEALSAGAKAAAEKEAAWLGRLLGEIDALIGTADRKGD